MRRSIVATGEQFGRLTVVHRTAPTDRHARFLCACSCGGFTRVRSANLRSGQVTSCGCGVGGKGKVSYRQAHHNLRKALGPARDHDCADCGAPAREWSLNVSTGPYAFSMDPAAYSPRCRPCHSAHDAQARKVGA